MRTVISGCVALCAIVSCGHVSKMAVADSAPVADAKGYDIVLNHVTPTDVIALLHWNELKMRPEGLTSVTANSVDNSLHVVATKEGFARVEDVVSKVDVPVRQVQVNVSVVLVPKSEVDSYGIAEASANREAATNNDFPYIAQGKLVAQMLTDFTQKGYVMGSPSIITTNNTLATLSMTSPLQSQGATVFSSFSITVRPRANSDNTVTLPITVVQGKSEKKAQTLTVTRTVPDGQTFVAGCTTPESSSMNNKLVLYFVTPHLLDMK